MSNTIHNCEIEINREQLPLKETVFDSGLMNKAHAYAANFDVSLQTLIEAALVQFMMTGAEPLPMRVCATHGCVFEESTSGTALACPVVEGVNRELIFFV